MQPLLSHLTSLLSSSANTATKISPQWSHHTASPTVVTDSLSHPSCILVSHWAPCIAYPAQIMLFFSPVCPWTKYHSLLPARSSASIHPQNRHPPTSSLLWSQKDTYEVFQRSNLVHKESRFIKIHHKTLGMLISSLSCTHATCIVHFLNEEIQWAAHTWQDKVSVAVRVCQVPTLWHPKKYKLETGWIAFLIDDGRFFLRE